MRTTGMMGMTMRCVQSHLASLGVTDIVFQPPPVQTADPDADDVDEQPLSPSLQANGAQHHSISSAVALGLSRSRSQQGLSPSPPPPSDTSARLDAIAKERDALRQEVIELRKSLENIQSNQDKQPPSGSESEKDAEIQSLKEELEEANEEKEHFETQYKNLLGRVNTIKTSLGDRLKADAVGSHEMGILHVCFRTAVLILCRLGSRSFRYKFLTSKNRSASSKRTTPL
ncbi:hypothetical protein DE146DRAFT_174443 [Phaeosphaeria sp. MPI-PUGE-AT-0046c]|nr:hypothetical protein DE146DRAFT_174443 [Phaeosphaeria sp. MPI-PUGE-AT-0046c]